MPSARSTLLSVISSPSPSDEPPRDYTLLVNARLLDDGVGRYLGIRYARREAFDGARERTREEREENNLSVDCYCLGASGRLSLAAILTRSAREPAFIFRITLPRCVFTVISLVPSSAPTCLFKKPETTNAMSSRSRRVSEAYPLRSACISASLPSAARLHSMACRMAFTNTSSPNGFVKNSTAPAFMAWTVIGTSPLPVMKMIGMSVRSTATRFWRSRPLRSGSVTSSTRQLGALTRGRARNSCADANVSACQPAHRISNSSDSRTETSSSTTKTIGVAPENGDGLDSPLGSLDEDMSIP